MSSQQTDPYKYDPWEMNNSTEHGLFNKWFWKNNIHMEK
jgi:hypothetical protein